MSVSFSSLFTSSPPPPTFTSASLIDLSSKVYIITSISRTTTAQAKILYNLHATVYIGCSSPSAFENTVKSIKQQCTGSKGTLKPFIYDPGDLHSIRPAIDEFLAEQWRLDVLFISNDEDLPASFLLAKMLLPRLYETASHFCHPNPSIRVIWAAPSTPVSPPPPELNLPHTLNTADIFYLLAHEFARRPHIPQPGNASLHAHTLPNSNPSGVQHVLADMTMPGSNLQRSVRKLVASDAKETEYAVCMLLYAGLAPEVRTGYWVVPWGRKGSVPEHVKECTTMKAGEEESISARLYGWCEENVRQYM